MILTVRFNGVTSIALTILFLSVQHLQAYTPVETFTLSCGTAGSSFDGERTWSGDTDSKLLVSRQDDSVSDKPTTQIPSSINPVPYSTARLSRSQFNYSFPVSAGPKFVRLFFYPAQYPSFPRNDASFTVQANGFTLLNGFNASVNADVEGTPTIFREYVVYVNDGEILILSFTPSSQQPNSYAFINGIEVLSMPSDLYYTPANDTIGFTFVGHNTQYSVLTSTALETEYRIKMRGQEISPKEDTGLFRNWSGDEEDYLIKNNDLAANTDGKMNITVVPDYVAPKELYRTARNMGTNTTFNKINNLTWEFPVDPGFIYVLRLHFCELDPNINEDSERVFLIYIVSQLADDHVDVMKLSRNQRGLAVQKSYAVLIPKTDNAQKKFNLSLQMHPYATDDKTTYSDAFLNGIEIFKVSNAGSNNLAGPNPDPLQTPQNNIPVVPKGKSSNKNGTTLIGIVAGVVSGVVLISLVIFFVFLSVTSKCGPLLFSMTKSANTHNSSLPLDLCRRFSLAEIIAATQNFDDIFIVGVGGFGHVYKGYIDDGSTPVAIKRLKLGSQQGTCEFLNEIEILSQLRHRHIVSLIGYCNDNKENILVYDFLTRGNLRDHLYNTDNPPLPWKQRLHICIGAARGLHYLHTGAKQMIIHRDVKTTNILLDDKWVAKVSDFGLSRVGPTGTSKSHVSTNVKGSFGYLDPEYYKRHRLTEKSDVYSFGVVLFEILCARPPLIRNAETEQVSLANCVRRCYQNGNMAHIVDPTLKATIAPECFKKFCDIGMSCLLEDGTQRPSINDVVWLLEFALQLQENAEQRENAGLVTNEASEKKDETSDCMFSNAEHNHGS